MSALAPYWSDSAVTLYCGQFEDLARALHEIGFAA